MICHNLLLLFTKHRGKYRNKPQNWAPVGVIISMTGEFFLNGTIEITKYGQCLFCLNCLHDFIQLKSAAARLFLKFSPYKMN